MNISGKELQLQIDNSTQTVINYGRNSQFALNSKQHLYLGGLPSEVASNALAKFHVKDTKSLEGCISDVQLNGQHIDLNANSVDKKDIQIGCIGIFDLCTGVLCQNNGSCITNSSLSNGYECQERKCFLIWR